MCNHKTTCGTPSILPHASIPVKQIPSLCTALKPSEAILPHPTANTEGTLTSPHSLDRTDPETRVPAPGATLAQLRSYQSISHGVGKWILWFLEDIRIGEHVPTKSQSNHLHIKTLLQVSCDDGCTRLWCK